MAQKNANFWARIAATTTAPLKPYLGQGQANTSRAHHVREHSRPLSQWGKPAPAPRHVVHYRGPLGPASFVPKKNQRPVSGEAKFHAFMSRSRGLPGQESVLPGLIPKEQRQRRARAVAAAAKRAQALAEANRQERQAIANYRPPEHHRSLLGQIVHAPIDYTLGGLFVKKTYEESVKAKQAQNRAAEMQAIANDPNLSPEQKRLQLAQLQAAGIEHLPGGFTGALSRIAAVGPRLLSQAGMAAINFPAGSFYLEEGLRKHPKQTLRELGQQALSGLQNPEAQPLSFLSTAAIPVTVGASGLARGSAAVGELGAGAGVRAAAAKFLSANREATAVPRVITNPLTGESGQGLYSRTAWVRRLQKEHDRLLGLNRDVGDVVMSAPTTSLRKMAQKAGVKDVKTMSRAELQDALSQGGGRFAQLHEMKLGELGQRAAELGFRPSKQGGFISKEDLRMFIRSAEAQTVKQGKLQKAAQPYIKSRLGVEQGQNVRVVHQPPTPEQAALRLNQIDEELARLEGKTGPIARRKREHLVTEQADLHALHEDVPMDEVMQHLAENPPPGTDKSLWTSGVDLVNRTVQTGQILLKPAYLPVNLAGQILLQLTQQGIKFPHRYYMVARAMREGGQELMRKIDETMGEGATRSMITGQKIFRGEGPVRKTGAKVAGATIEPVHAGLTKFYSKVMDVPFRRAAFMHEAARLGYRSTADLERLFKEAGPDLTIVSRRANRAMLDYARMGKAERDVIRRLYYFYPFTKATVHYGGHLVREHPIQAGAMAQTGLYGKQKNVGFFGSEIPSYMEGLIKMGERNIPGIGKVPLASNPAAASILGAPGQLLQMVTGGATGEPDLSSAAAPIVQGLAASLLSYDIGRRQQMRGRAGLGGFFTRPVTNFAHSFPAVRMATDVPQIINRPDKSKLLVPYGKQDFLGYSLLGPAAKRPYNLYVARSRYRAEQQRRQTDPAKRAQATMAYWREDLLREVNLLRHKSGLTPLHEIPKEFDPYIKQEIAFRTALGREQKHVGHKLTMGERAIAALKYAAERSGRAKKNSDGSWSYPPDLQKFFAKLADPQYKDAAAALYNGYSGFPGGLKKQVFFPNGRLIPALTTALKKNGARITLSGS